MNMIKFLKSLILFLFLFLFISVYVYPETLKAEYQTIVKSFVLAVKHNDIVMMSKMVKYPLHREHPIPAVKSENEFKKRFYEIFDKKLIEEISNSSVDTDWNEAGWRGIALNNGTVWLDYDGKIISINYQSQKEKQIKQSLIESETKLLHPSLRMYKAPILFVESESLGIRIDDLGNYNYRYAAWPLHKSQSEKPDLVIHNGKWVPDGSGGNHYYEFNNGNSKYQIYIYVIGSDETPPGILRIFKDNVPVLEETIKIIHGR